MKHRLTSSGPRLPLALIENEPHGIDQQLGEPATAAPLEHATVAKHTDHDPIILDYDTLASSSEEDYSRHKEGQEPDSATGLSTHNSTVGLHKTACEVRGVRPLEPILSLLNADDIKTRTSFSWHDMVKDSSTIHLQTAAIPRHQHVNTGIQGAGDLRLYLLSLGLVDLIEESCTTRKHDNSFYTTDSTHCFCARRTVNTVIRSNHP